jgi:haloalkane dehalogenase
MPDPTMNRIDGLRGWRYGEVLLVRHEAGSFSAEVWNTMGFNECPQAAWDELDAGEIAAERGATLALMNGPRH